MGERFLRHPDRPAHFLVGTGLVDIGDVVLAQVLDDRAVPDRLSAIDPRARVELDAWQLERVALRQPLNHHGPALERKAQVPRDDGARGDFVAHAAPTPGPEVRLDPTVVGSASQAPSRRSSGSLAGCAHPRARPWAPGA